jgi:membrane-associated phospholipid phosphatase
MRVIIYAVMLLFGCVLPAVAQQTGQVEPRAGTWKTWIVTSPQRVPPPPDSAATEEELAELASLVAKRDPTSLDQIAYWDTGSPSYRWSEIAVAEIVKRNMLSLMAVRDLALMHVAIYDAMVAAWDSKYAYNRSHPSTARPDLKTVVPNPPSPSYPAEHAVAAGAASEVLAYLFPDRADYFRQKAQEAARSRVMAGVNYPSDIEAGLDLGKRVAASVIEYGRSDGSDAKWTGSVPAGPGKWTGTNPVMPMVATWKPWVLSSQSEFRTPPPVPYDSPAKAAELAELKTFPRTPATNVEAMFWESAVGGLRSHQYWADQIGRKTLEYRLDYDAPRAARDFALPYITLTDAFIACWDSKYTYWAIRPFQLDPDLKTVVPTPNHPSYPSAHACTSIAVGKVLGYVFPRDADYFAALGERAAESRIWAGIHYRSDIDEGRKLARGVADKVIARAKQDGSEQ